LRGEAALSRGDVAQAGVAWQAAYTIAGQLGVPLGPYLADLARLRARQGQAELARELITESLAIGGLHVALAAAEVYLSLGESVEAQRQIVQAYQEAWAEGPPHSFFLELSRARVVLTAQNLSEPQLPPFNPAQVPPVPYETEIRAFISELEADRKVAKTVRSLPGSISGIVDLGKIRALPYARAGWKIPYIWLELCIYSRSRRP
jgi:hypothetical protein